MMEHQAARGERLIYQAKRIWSHLSSPGPHESGFSNSVPTLRKKGGPAPILINCRDHALAWLC